MDKASIKRCVLLLGLLDGMIQQTLSGRGYFLLPLMERQQGGVNELQLLANVVSLRFDDIRNPEIVGDPFRLVRVVGALRQLFVLLEDYIEQGDAFPPADAERQEALQYLLKNVFSD